MTRCKRPGAAPLPNPAPAAQQARRAAAHLQRGEGSRRAPAARQAAVHLAGGEGQGGEGGEGSRRRPLVGKAAGKVIAAQVAGGRGAREGSGEGGHRWRATTAGKMNTQEMYSRSG